MRNDTEKLEQENQKLKIENETLKIDIEDFNLRFFGKTALNDPELDNAIKKIMSLLDFDELKKIRDSYGENINPTIKKFIAEAEKNLLKIYIRGSKYQALTINTLTFFTGFAATVIISPAVNSMEELSSTLKFLLVSIPLIPTSLLQFPLGRLIDQNGGINAVIVMRLTSLIGSLGLTILSATTDITTIKDFDLRYGLMLFFGFLAGIGGAVFQLINSSIYWNKKKNIALVQSLHGGIGGSALGLSLLFLEFMQEKLGLPGTFGLFSAISALGTFLAWKFLYPSPYHQLLKKYDSQQSKELATLYDQELFPMQQKAKFWKNIFDTLHDRRALVLILNIMVSAGGFLSSGISLFITLVSILGLSHRQAVVITACGSLWSTFIRTIAGRLVDRVDHRSRGAITFMISSLFIMIGGALLAIPRPLPSLGYVIAAKAIIDTGFGAGTTATFRMVQSWSEPKNENLKPYNVGTMTGIVSSFGASSGVIFPLIVALLVELLGDRGYQDNFYLIVTLTFFASTATLFQYKNINKLSWDLFPHKEKERENASPTKITVFH